MKKVLIFIFIFLVSVFLYGKCIEINNFKIREYSINNEKISSSFEELKIIHFSDLLYSSAYENKLDDLAKNINELQADIIIFSGDLLKANEKYSNKDFKLLKSALKDMNASLYKYAVIGDNDKYYLEEYKDILYEADFKLLDNQNELLFYKDITPINIIGLTDISNINELLVTDVPYYYSIAIIHEPDNFDNLKNYNIDTIISGHSLGGLINVPYNGGLIKKNGANIYINDYYKSNNTEIFISNGLGYEKYNFRLFNTPSINVYRFSK